MKFNPNDHKFQCSEVFLRGIEVPAATKTYEPVSHGMIIDWIRDACQKSSMPIRRVDFIQGNKGKQMAAMFHMESASDQDSMTYQVCAINSYDRSLPVKGVAGATVFICSNGMMLGDHKLNLVHRPHLNTLERSRQFFRDIILARGRVMQNIREQRDGLLGQPLTQREMAELAGRLFVEERILGSYELNELARQIQHPSFDYGTGNDNAWAFYNHTTHALKLAAPREYAEKHTAFNTFMHGEFLV